MAKARERVVADLAELGHHDPETDREDRLIDLAHSDRSKTPIEPYLADQWFVKMDELAQSAMDAVTSGQVKIVPERYTKTYLDWLSEKRDWPVGRQLWWGHRVPVWTRTFTDESERQKVETEAGQICQVDDGSPSELITVYHEWDEATRAGVAYLCLLEDDPEFVRRIESAGYKQEEEVLDTWFCSALWPHSTLGWPEETPELAKFYPTSTLITSRDIITLWVARMVLMGEYNMGEVPFHEVYIHPKILDGFGETMSKSKGNGIDPLDVIQKFGADALRFGIAYLTTETQDVRMPVEFECPHCQATIAQTKKNRVLPRVKCDKCKQEFSTQWAEKPEDVALPRGAVVSERFELGRNFCNKLWNAARFTLMNLEGFTPGAVATEALHLEDRWLLSRLATVTREVTEALEGYRYADAARTLYDFAWDEFCSFYVEMTKARFALADERVVAQRVIAHALDTLLRLLHPMVPFVTEEVWHLLGEIAPSRDLHDPDTKAAESLCIAPWPAAWEADQDDQIEAQFAEFQGCLRAVREIRSRQNIAMAHELRFLVTCPVEVADRLEGMQPYLLQMARAVAGEMGPQVVPPPLAASVPLSGALTGIEVHVDIAEHIDVEAERKRLATEVAKLTKYVASLQGKLANERFVAGAPAEVVEAERQKLAEAERHLVAVEQSLEKLIEAT